MRPLIYSHRNITYYHYPESVFYDYFTSVSLPIFILCVCMHFVSFILRLCRYAHCNPLTLISRIYFVIACVNVTYGLSLPLPRSTTKTYTHMVLSCFHCNRTCSSEYEHISCDMWDSDDVVSDGFIQLSHCTEALNNKPELKIISNTHIRSKKGQW